MVREQVCAQDVLVFASRVVEIADSINSLELLNSLYFEFLGQMRYAALGFLDVVEQGNAYHLEIRFGYGLDAWRIHSSASGHDKDDVILREAAKAFGLFYSSDLHLGGRAPRSAKEVLEVARDMGLQEVVIRPFGAPNDLRSFVLFGGSPCLSGSAEERAALYVLTSYYANIGRRFRERKASQANVALTPRQRECLRWVKSGKSSTDIAGIIGVSSDVIDEHIAKACERMGVRTRMQAVVKASERGLLGQNQ